MKWLLEKGTIVVCGGGGGIPTVYGEDGKLHGVECVIDKDRVASLLAQQLDADFFIMATDVSAVSVGWGTPVRAGRSAARRRPRSGASTSRRARWGRRSRRRATSPSARGRRPRSAPSRTFRAILAGEAGTLVSNGVATIEWAAPESLALFTE